MGAEPIDTIEGIVALGDSHSREFPELSIEWFPEQPPSPSSVVLNEPLAIELGLDPDRLRSPGGLAVLSGQAIPAGSRPVAQAYAGHQFGGYSPRLGDGRALLLGDLVAPDGRRFDLHLKGSGRTPFARGGDGLAVLGPMLREYIVSESMAALGVPTSRILAVSATGGIVRREGPQPGAVLVRVASSHLRIGTFQFASGLGDDDVLRRLVHYSLRRHHPEAPAPDGDALGLLAAVRDVQARLVAQWMLVGFIHGVLNTDNVSIAGETIDFGPCAFMDRFDPGTVFSSIDSHGRYAYGNQPGITLWNLARFAEALLPVIDPDTDRAVARATSVLEEFVPRYQQQWREGLAKKIGLDAIRTQDPALLDELPDVLAAASVDMTSFFRCLTAEVAGDPGALVALLSASTADTRSLSAWLDRWRERTALDPHPRAERAASMAEVNPVRIPRNHLVEAALSAATNGDLDPLHRLVDGLRSPFHDDPALRDLAEPAPEDFGPYRTFCGT